MLVLKFGGTSVGSVENMTNVKNIINDGQRKVVVLSAMSGTTNALINISECIKFKEVENALELISNLHSTYQRTVSQLIQHIDLKNEVVNYVNTIFEILKTNVDVPYSEILSNKIVAQGEFLLCFFFIYFPFYIRQNFNRIINELPEADIYITQGFICLDAEGQIANLQRGGSDYTATIIGAALKAKEVQIWTDIDGFHNNDPRFVPDTHAISNLSFDEAAELAYFGAKILHPQTVMPVRDLDIPVRLKDTNAPTSHGTLITNEIHGEGIKAIAAKDGITAIKIKSARMLLAQGFLKKVFEIFEKYDTSIDMITTSEIAISLTIDDTKNLLEITAELEKFSTVDVDSFRTIVCLVGNHIVYHPDTPKLFQILQDVNVRMISYGGSNNNISLLINTSDKIETLRKLNRYVFDLVPA